MYSIAGAYVPLTMEGNIMVDGILASSYPVNHDLAHIVMTQFLWFPEIIEWVLVRTMDPQLMSTFLKS